MTIGSLRLSIMMLEGFRSRWMTPRLWASANARASLRTSRALWRELGPRYWGFDGAYVKLRPGATLGELTSQAQALARRHQYRATGGQIFVADEATQAATVERSIRPQAVTLALFALLHLLAAFRVWPRMVLRLPSPVLGLGYAAVVLLVLVLAPGSEKAFIYFQF